VQRVEEKDVRDYEAAQQIPAELLQLADAFRVVVESPLRIDQQSLVAGVAFEIAESRVLRVSIRRFSFCSSARISRIPSVLTC